MRFCDKLKQARAAQNMTQAALADIIGVSTRTIQNYEMGKMYPKQTQIYARLASVFSVPVEYLLNDEDYLLMEAQERGGAEAMEDVDRLISRVSGLFAGGTLSEEDKDKVMRALTMAYWRSKELKAGMAEV